MTPLRFKQTINLILLVIGFFLPPLYFLLKKRFWIAIGTLLTMVIGHGYGILLCMALSVVSGIYQIIIDWKYRTIIEDNLSDDWAYLAVKKTLGLIGIHAYNRDESIAYGKSAEDHVKPPRI